MAKVWIDCEWNDYKGELISMALVDEGGNEWYGVLGCENPSQWVAENVMPNLFAASRLARGAVTKEFMQKSLTQYLAYFDSVHLVADWPEDIQHFCNLLIVGPGQRINTPPLTMEVKRDINSEASEIPHNALADVRAMRRMDILRVD